MSQSDPTDHALAAIASILDQSEPVREPPVPIPDIAIPPPVVEEPFALATNEAETSQAENSEVETSHVETNNAESSEADGYSKVGPGPMPAIRFKWTVRRDDDGQYYVDETIGNSTPIIAGPMGAGSAVKLVDQRESDAILRYEQLKSEMTSRSAVTNHTSGASDET